MKRLCEATMFLVVTALVVSYSAGKEPETQKVETLDQVWARLALEAEEAYQKCPYAVLSQDYFSRFSRDPEARCLTDEILIEASWQIILPDEAHAVTKRMAKHLAEFLQVRMEISIGIKSRGQEELKQPTPKSIVLLEAGGGQPEVKESFTISVAKDTVIVQGRDREGLRDGIVRLVQGIGLRQAPILQIGEVVYRPRLRTRLGAVPWMGSIKDAVFMGYNAVFATGGSLYALSTAQAIPELKDRQRPEELAALIKSVQEAKEYGLKAYARVDTRKKFPKDDPVFAAHPEIRGALTWSADGEYVLCTEQPLVKQYLAESVEGIFREADGLDGLVCIIGGEGFYHCYMRSFGTAKGHTNCPRCEPLGAETVVANLCNGLMEAATKVNPNAEIVVWPYSAEHVWSQDRPQAELIKKLKPGVAIFTEIEKDEYVDKPEGVRKHIWDYSIDLIGPGERARQQVAACKAAGIAIYMKSEPEIGFEAPLLPQIPCLDRWADRAEALAACGADGAWVFPAFRPSYATSPVEAYQFFWWQPVDDRENILLRFAERIAGREAGPHLREAWRLVSQAIDWSPELPSYYTGPYYLGPAHPMCADPAAELPEVFFGQYLFMAEAVDAEGLKVRPTFVKSPTGNAAIFGRFYRQMENLLRQAVEEIEKAEPLVAERQRLTFDAEAKPIRWLYHTARTEANFYESCRLRDALLAFVKQPGQSAEEIAGYQTMFKRWREVLIDERQNTSEALPIVRGDMRFDCYFGSDHTFPHITDMLDVKLRIIEREIEEFLPSVARRCNFAF